MMTLLKYAAFFAVALCWAIRSTQAGYVLQFSPTGSSVPANNFTTGVGVPLNVDVHIAQTAGDSLLTTAGIIAMGFRVDFDPSKLDTMAPVTFTFSSDFAVGQESILTSNSLRIYGGRLIDALPVTGNPILLGTITLKPSTLGMFTVNVGDNDPSSPDFADFSFGGTSVSDNLDQRLIGPTTAGVYQFSVTAVPEPSSLVLFGAIAAVGVVARWRKRRGRNSI
jgi:hypothetical protein